MRHAFGRGHRANVRPRHTPGQMNKLEQAYADRLELLLRAGDIRRYRFEAIKFRLAANTFYTPDFMVVTETQVEFHEVKGWWEDDARVKIKVAAEQYPEFAFFAVQKKKDSWICEEF